MTYDAVVVGSGPNGLAAAITLAAAGRSVHLIEAAQTPGGGLRSVTRDGFVHDVCAAVVPLYAASPFFRRLALDVPLVHPEIPFAHPFDGGRAATSQRLAVPALWHAPRSAAALARRYDEDRRALLAGAAAHSMLPLTQRPTAGVAMVLAWLAHRVGWPFVAGGSQVLADALVDRFTKLGGTVTLGTRVDRLPRAKAVLLDVTPRQFVRMAALPASYRRKLAAFRYGPGVFKVDWALDGPIPWAATEVGRAGTVHLGGTFAEIAASEADANEGRHAERPFVLLAQQTVFDPSRAPAGKHTAWAYCHVPAGSTVDMTERIEAQVERFAPGFRDRILARVTMDTAAMERRNANYVDGHINGGALDLRQFFARPVARAVPYRTPLPGVYLCSSSTPPGGGVHGMCGHWAARAALRKELR